MVLDGIVERAFNAPGGLREQLAQRFPQLATLEQISEMGDVRLVKAKLVPHFGKLELGYHAVSLVQGAHVHVGQLLMDGGVASRITEHGINARGYYSERGIAKFTFTQDVGVVLQLFRYGIDLDTVVVYDNIERYCRAEKTSKVFVATEGFLSGLTSLRDDGAYVGSEVNGEPIGAQRRTELLAAYVREIRAMYASSQRSVPSTKLFVDAFGVCVNDVLNREYKQ